MAEIGITVRGVIDSQAQFELVPRLQDLLAEAGAEGVQVTLYPNVVEVLHDSPFECDECGGPSPATSSSGCRWCDGQGDIVPRGMARRRTWRPDAVRP